MKYMIRHIFFKMDPSVRRSQTQAARELVESVFERNNAISPGRDTSNAEESNFPWLSRRQATRSALSSQPRPLQVLCTEITHTTSTFLHHLRTNNGTGLFANQNSFFISNWGYGVCVLLYGTSSWIVTDK
jgi:hypothetical protein